MLAALLWGVSDVIGVSVTRRLGVLLTTLVFQITAVAVTTPYLVFGESLSRLSLDHWGMLFGLSFLGTGVLVGFYKALQLGPLTVVAPVVSSYSVVVIPLAVVFVGDRLSWLQVVGAAVIVGGVALVSVNLRGVRSGGGWMGRGVPLALAITLGIGVYTYSVGVLSKELGWFLPLYVTQVFTLAILAPIAIVRIRRPRLRQVGPALLGAVLVAIFGIGGFFAYTRGTEIGVLSLVAAASTSHPILPVLGGLLIYRERLAPVQIAGLVAVIGGLLALSLS